MILQAYLEILRKTIKEVTADERAEQQKLMKAAYTLKMYCLDTFCPRCPFYREDSEPIRCRLSGMTPASYDVMEADTED